MSYDLMILGGGPAGYNAAERAARAGMKVLVAEGRALGGVCLNEGCIPTKTLLYSAKIYDYAKHSAEYGVSFSDAAIDHSFVIDRKDRVVKTLVGGIGATLKKMGVDVVSGFGTILGRNADGFELEANGERFSGKRLLICTGSTASVPPIPGLRESIQSGFGMTNREILDLKEVPKELAVIGGGVIGLEMASYFNSIGSHVTVLEMLDHIGGPTDREIAKILQNNYAKKGVTFLLGAKVTSIGTGCVNYELEGKSSSVSCDRVLISIGRRPHTEGIGAESIGLLLERGAVVTNEFCQTNVAGVWAAGDVNGKSMLAHTAYREGEVAVSDMLGKRDRVNYLSIPSVIYTNPEVASVGETEDSAKSKGLDVICKTMTLKMSGRYLAENEKGDGIVKLVVGAEHKNLLGLSVIGSYASEMIYGCAMMVEKEMRISEIQKFVFPHPTVCEVIREATFSF
ncbi:MAG: dihydrolipoyl dehydrogenase [Clostridia bacterium]|nr:dihydrolipoyl dehydrogenase [Clostridia bacterium]